MHCLRSPQITRRTATGSQTYDAWTTCFWWLSKSATVSSWRGDPVWPLPPVSSAIAIVPCASKSSHWTFPSHSVMAALSPQHCLSSSMCDASPFPATLNIPIVLAEAISRFVSVLMCDAPNTTPTRPSPMRLSQLVLDIPITFNLQPHLSRHCLPCGPPAFQQRARWTHPLYIPITLDHNSFFFFLTLSIILVCVNTTSPPTSLLPTLQRLRSPVHTHHFQHSCAPPKVRKDSFSCPHRLSNTYHVDC